jgi:hypothetical protein
LSCHCARRTEFILLPYSSCSVFQPHRVTRQFNLETVLCAPFGALCDTVMSSDEDLPLGALSNANGKGHVAVNGNAYSNGDADDSPMSEDDMPLVCVHSNLHICSLPQLPSSHRLGRRSNPNYEGELRSKILTARTMMIPHLLLRRPSRSILLPYMANRKLLQPNLQTGRGR